MSRSNPPIRSQNAIIGAEKSESRTAQPQLWIPSVFQRLLSAFGPQHWWPVCAGKSACQYRKAALPVCSSTKPCATESNQRTHVADTDTDTEIVVGAILTQNTAWTNVERAIENLSAANALSWTVLRRLSLTNLETLIRPSGTYRRKAKRLKAFVDHLWEDQPQCGLAGQLAGAAGKLESLLAGDLETVRTRLLGIHGIGPETADAILLYAGNRPTFVVDAYTKRILRRHHFIDPAATYDDVRSLFMNWEFGTAKVLEKDLLEPSRPSPASPVPDKGAVSRRLFPASLRARLGKGAFQTCSANSQVRIQDSDVPSRYCERTVFFQEYHALLVALGKQFCRSKANCDGCPLADLPHDETL